MREASDEIVHGGERKGSEAVVLCFLSGARLSPNSSSRPIDPINNKYLGVGAGGGL